MSGVTVCSHVSPATLLLRAGPVSQGSARAGQEEGWGEAWGVNCCELSRFLIGLFHKRKAGLCMGRKAALSYADPSGCQSGCLGGHRGQMGEPPGPTGFRSGVNEGLPVASNQGEEAGRV